MNFGTHDGGKGCADPKAVDRLLLKHYGAYRTQQKNVNLLDELLYFMLSTRTTTPSCEVAYRAFKKSFPSHAQIPKASPDMLAVPLRNVGLAYRRASDIKSSWSIIQERFGRVTLTPLRKMPVNEAEAFLLTLPGIGLKIARCFLMFGLHAPVFAVDTHIWRLSQRLGWIPRQKLPSPHAPEVDVIQAMVPMTDPVSLHVNLIFLGRDFCNSREQNCAECPLRTVCPSRAG